MLFYRQKEKYIRSEFLFSFYFLECTLAGFIGVNMPGIGFRRILAFLEHKMTALRSMGDSLFNPSSEPGQAIITHRLNTPSRHGVTAGSLII
jgi:hypothetical protein